jgi:hypothetical protein
MALHARRAIVIDLCANQIAFFICFMPGFCVGFCGNKPLGVCKGFALNEKTMSDENGRILW